MINWWVVGVVTIISIVAAFLVYIYTPKLKMLAVLVFTVPIAISFLLCFIIRPVPIPPVPSKSPAATGTLQPVAAEIIEPVVIIEPQSPLASDIVSISIKTSATPDEYKVLLSLPNEEGQFIAYEYYYSSYDRYLLAEYNSSLWVLHKQFQKTTKFRVEIYSKSKTKTIYISDLYTIEIQPQQRKTELYSQSYESKEGIAVYDKQSDLTISINYIYSTGSYCAITYPNGEEWTGLIEPGESKTYKYQGIDYKVTLMGLDRDNKLYNVSIQEISP